MTESLEEIIDYGNALDVVEPSIHSYEKLAPGLVRLFIIKKVGGKTVLDHTDVMTKAAMVAVGKRFLEIAAEMDSQPDTLAEPHPRYLS